MKELTNLELLMEYMEQNQYFIGNDLLAKYNELLQKEKKEQLRIGGVSQQRELLLAYNEEINQCMVDSQDILEESDVDEFLANYSG